MCFCLLCQWTRRPRPFRLLACSLVALLGRPVWADAIDDASFFDSIRHTLITFETDGEGLPVIVPSGSVIPMPSDEYSAFGILLGPSVGWANDAAPTFDAAQAIGGSLPNAITGFVDVFDLVFTVPVHAFGFWVVNNDSVSTLPMFLAFDANDNAIEAVVFEGGLVDGTIGVAEYGFMGISSAVEIGRVRISKEATIFDNLMFSAVPAPGALGLLTVACFATWRRSRHLGSTTA